MRMLNKIKKILMIELGTLIFALSVGMFILPGRILTGGVAGITSLLAPFVPFSEDFMNIGINTFLFIIGSIFLGREFFTNTLIYSISYPFALLFVTRVLPDTIDIESDLALIAVVGRGMKSTRGTAGRIFSALAHAHVNVKMIDQGSSELNIIIGVANSDFEAAIKAIYDIFVVSQL